MMMMINDHAVDYLGFPADRSTTGGWLPAALILGIEAVERLSTVGIAVNLVTYLDNPMHLPSATSATIVTNLLGSAFLLSLLGGFLADSYLGRYLTIAIFSIIQALGTGTLAIVTKVPELQPPPCNGPACKQANAFQMGILYLALYLTALGTGGLKSSVSGYATDQFDEKDANEKAHMTSFFERFFFFISIGTLIAVTVLVYIQDRLSRSLGYGLCFAAMAVAILLFLSGSRRYRYKKPSGSPILHILHVIVAAVRKRKMKPPSTVEKLYENSPQDSRIQHTSRFRFLDKAAIIAEDDLEKDSNGASAPKPWRLCSVTRIEEVKKVVAMLPIWATTIVFWTTYAQMITFSVEQASTMERTIKNFTIPAASLTVFFVIAILITLATYDRLIIPLWKKWKGKPGFTNLERIGIGLVLSTLGMAVAAVVERKRLSGVAFTSVTTSTTLPISVFLLVPQFFLIGSGEGFMYAGQLDFFITESPKGMKAMSTSLFLTTLSLGFFFSSLLVSIVKNVTAGGAGRQGWLADKINQGRLDCFYGLLAVIGFINFLLYLFCTLCYKLKEEKVMEVARVNVEHLSSDEEMR